jgi:hypothetical protein
VFDEKRFLTTKPTDSTFTLDSFFSLIPKKWSLTNPSNTGLENIDLENIDLKSVSLEDLPSLPPTSSSHPADLASPSLSNISPAANLTLDPQPSSAFPSSNSSVSNPYHIAHPIPRELPKINFAPFYLVMEDIEDWSTVDSHNTASLAFEDDVLNNSSSTLTFSSENANNFQSGTNSQTQKPPS